MNYTIKLTHAQLEMLIQSIMNENKAWNSIKENDDGSIKYFLKHDVAYKGKLDHGMTNTEWANLSDSILENLVNSYTYQNNKGGV